ncbi:MAG TPA: 4-hydroxy-3-methylbut-2-enyl diphosphate reductase [Methylomirabilota bacterium]|nr:4-hydroxy-3-methylbut-2-enyl diphosphate reductase [Methylomirabilota bacterium]
MRILRATHLGMCFGVRDAIALAHHHVQQKPVTVLGDLVHNETVLRTLREQGVRFAAELDGVETSTVLITAHGTSERALARVREKGFEVVEATCPLVHHAHRTLQALVREGFHPIVIGQHNHVEVRGLTGDLDEYDVVLTEAEIEGLAARPRLGIVSQTTQPIERVRYLVNCIRNRFPDSEVVFRDTVCQPTKQRQSAAIELAQQCDVVVVIGGAHSNNTRELVQTCSRYCPRVHHVQQAGDLRRDWFAGATTVGITAGTSTPDDIIDSVERAAAQMADWKAAA